MADELRAVDADHFWIGGLMVDLVQLRYELNSLNAQAQRDQRWDVHERNRVFGDLRRRAEWWSKGNLPTESDLRYVKERLVVANHFGLHTGYVSKEERCKNEKMPGRHSG
jgi:hypothetical protein